MLQSYAFANIVREAKTHQIDAYIQSGEQSGEQSASGMQSLDGCLLSYVREGLVSLEDAMKYALYPEQQLASRATIARSTRSSIA